MEYSVDNKRIKKKKKKKKQKKNKIKIYHEDKPQKLLLIPPHLERTPTTPPNKTYALKDYLFLD
jgi:hypothetical protein